MSEPYLLGALDFCCVHEGMSPVAALKQTLDLAPALEELGYSRYWLAEHHGFLSAHSAPEMLVPLLAGTTTRIHVGTAGILLRLYSPFKVATDFQLLNALFPGRIDLGLARGVAPAQVEELLLEGRQGAPPYESKVRDLLGFLRGTSDVAVSPRNPAPPEVWILGTNTTSMRLAAEHGTAFCLALFFPQTVDLRDILAEYRDRFRPGPGLQAPRWSVAFAGVCHEDEAEARRIADSRLPDVIPSLVGTPGQCREQVEALRDRCGTRELVFLDLCKEYGDRVRSYRLLAEALGIEACGESEPPE